MPHRCAPSVGVNVFAESAYVGGYVLVFGVYSTSLSGLLPFSTAA